MDPKGKINFFRRRITRFFTKSIVLSSKEESLINIDLTQVKKILIVRPNHRLGNTLLLTPLIKDVSNIFPYAEIHLFLMGSLGEIVFENNKYVTKIIRLPRKPFKNLLIYFESWFSLFKEKYDISINANHISSSGKIAVKLSDSNYKFYNHFNENISHYSDYNHNAKNPIYNFRFVIRKKMKFVLNKNIPLLEINLREYEIENGKKIIDSLFNNNKPVISIFTYATGDKCLSQDWWYLFYNKLNQKFTSFNILEILPIENISSINFSARTFYSKDIREIASVMSQSVIFIGADSGMMHLASSSPITTIGLFKSTNPELYGVYGNNSVSVDTNTLNNDNIIDLINNKLNN